MCRLQTCKFFFCLNTSSKCLCCFKVWCFWEQLTVPRLAISGSQSIEQCTNNCTSSKGTRINSYSNFFRNTSFILTRHFPAMQISKMSGRLVHRFPSATGPCQVRTRLELRQASSQGSTKNGEDLVTSSHNVHIRLLPSKIRHPNPWTPEFFLWKEGEMYTISPSSIEEVMVKLSHGSELKAVDQRN